MAGLSLMEIALRLCAAMAAGVVIGLNRDLRGKPAGVRTLGLVGLGAALATIAASGMTTTYVTNIDAISRAVQGIITGIGFLGAGVIIKEEDGRRIRGLTTAASIWVVACFGMICGIGAWSIGAIALLLAILLLMFGKSIEQFARWILPEREEDENGA